MNKPVIVIPAYKPDLKLLPLIEDILHQSAGTHIIVVDDGSGPKHHELFAAVSRLKDVTLLRHATNLGKGQALKTAMNHFLLEFPTAPGVVTADADGQHLVSDILRVCEYLCKKPTELCLGYRKFEGKVPLRSSFGNSLTRQVLTVFIGKRLYDTQTGLRAIPTELMADFLKIKSVGYEFELEMLIRTVHKGVTIGQIPIETVYENNNASSHFNPLLDSLRIYFVFLRFSVLSLLTAVVDNIVFAIAFSFCHHILVSTFIGRVIAGGFNFSLAKAFVFRSSGSTKNVGLKYASLVLAFMFVSYGLITSMVNFLGMNVLLAKVLAETFLFLASFSIQNLLVFSEKGRKPKSPDWVGTLAAAEGAPKD